ncbi:hypothetical protein ACRQEG_08335 [Actinotignum sp. GS-2025f]|uniref:hypothetical protein n=3 Tax=unclassified Actinotignum TaxID=2632702 RepID=UPI003F48B914
MARIPTAHAETRALLTSLARRGWGELRDEKKGTRCVLEALVKLLPYKSGQGAVTQFQLHQATGYSRRWISVCLQRLEAMGIITYARGGVMNGKKHPGFIRIIKKKLVELIKGARRRHDDDTRAHNARTDAAIAESRSNGQYLVSVPVIRDPEKEKDEVPASDTPLWEVDAPLLTSREGVLLPEHTHPHIEEGAGLAPGTHSQSLLANRATPSTGQATRPARLANLPLQPKQKRTLSKEEQYRRANAILMREAAINAREAVSREGVTPPPAPASETNNYAQYAANAMAKIRAQLTAHLSPAQRRAREMMRERKEKK